MGRTIARDSLWSTFNTERECTFMNKQLSCGDEGSEGVGTTIKMSELARSAASLV